ncbi:MAG: septum formation initiator family protein [Deltaproteobacteria bacterium]|nr:septum formation initiator family protein [Deltaproteobacteria bacterium]
MAEPQKRSPWWLLLAGVLALACLFAVHRGYSTLRRAHQELVQVRQANLELDAVNQGLYRQAERLRDDPQALEQACRREMNLVRPDEVVYEAAPQAGKEKR